MSNQRQISRKLCGALRMFTSGTVPDASSIFKGLTQCAVRILERKWLYNKMLLGVVPTWCRPSFNSAQGFWPGICKTPHFCPTVGLTAYFNAGLHEHGTACLCSHLGTASAKLEIEHGADERLKKLKMVPAISAWKESKSSTGVAARQEAGP